MRSQPELQFEDHWESVCRDGVVELRWKWYDHQCKCWRRSFHVEQLVVPPIGWRPPESEPEVKHCSLHVLMSCDEADAMTQFHGLRAARHIWLDDCDHD